MRLGETPKIPLEEASFRHAFRLTTSRDICVRSYITDYEMHQWPPQSKAATVASESMAANLEFGTWR